jgi:hypothetical protein
VLDGEEALAAALAPLSAVLEHLSIANLPRYGHPDQPRLFPTAMLQQMQQLTFLELAGITLQGPDEASPALQPLQALTRLVDLRLNNMGPRGGENQSLVSDSMLSGMQHLTRLELCVVRLEAGPLAGKTNLQHLLVNPSCFVGGDVAGTAQLLSHLQHMQQLTHLALIGVLQAYEMEYGNPADDGSDSYQEHVDPPAAAYAALTASSKLQYLDIRLCSLPVGV